VSFPFVRKASPYPLGQIDPRFTLIERVALGLLIG
jgi:hypothetical protein